MASEELEVSSLLNKVINKYHYAVESIKNRYPCKIIEIRNINKFDESTIIKYQAASKLHIRTTTAQDILKDPLLIEKFHPTDGVKLGFIACGEILLNDNVTIEQARKLYIEIANRMFQEIDHD